MGRSTYWQIHTPHHHRTSRLICKPDRFCRAQTGRRYPLYLHFIYTLSTLIYLHFIYTLARRVMRGGRASSSSVRPSVRRPAVTRPRGHMSALQPHSQPRHAEAGAVWAAPLSSRSCTTTEMRESGGEECADRPSACRRADRHAPPRPRISPAGTGFGIFRSAPVCGAV